MSTFLAFRNRIFIGIAALAFALLGALALAHPAQAAVYFYKADSNGYVSDTFYEPCSYDVKAFHLPYFGVSDKSSGIYWDASSRTLTVRNLKFASEYPYTFTDHDGNETEWFSTYDIGWVKNSDPSLDVRGNITIKLENGCDLRDIIIRGSSKVTIQNSGNNSVGHILGLFDESDKGCVKFTGSGTLKCTGVNVYGATVAGPNVTVGNDYDTKDDGYNHFCFSVAQSGLTVSKGTLFTKGCISACAVDSDNSRNYDLLASYIKVTGGTVNSWGAVLAEGSMSVSGGTITCQGGNITNGFHVSGNYTMTGGTVNVTSYGNAHAACFNKACTISGGKLNATVKKTAQTSEYDHAIYLYNRVYGDGKAKVSIKASCIGTIAGPVTVGVPFQTSAGTFESLTMLKNPSDTHIAKLVTGANKKSASINSVKLGGITYKVTSVAANAFKSKSKLKTVTLGSNVKSIGAGAFKNCKKLTTVKKGSALTSIGANAFEGCKKLKSFKVTSKSLAKVGAKAFKSCSKLKTVTFSKTKSLKKSGVKNCFKSSKVKTVKVLKSKVKAYKKVFKKKNCGKTVTVKKA